MSSIGRICASLKADGGRCKNRAANTSDYCPAHDPSRKEARRRAASKGGRRGGRGRAGVSGELAEIKRELRNLAEKAKHSDDYKNYTAAASIYSILLGYIREEREQRIESEHEERIKSLEASNGNARQTS